MVLQSLNARVPSAWVRSGIVVVAVVITLAALFVDGFPPASWKAWLGIQDSKPVVAALIPNRVVPGRVTVTMPKPRGNNSSVSPVPLPLILVSTRVGRNSHEGFAGWAWTPPARRRTPPAQSSRTGRAFPRCTPTTSCYSGAGSLLACT